MNPLPGSFPPRLEKQPGRLSSPERPSGVLSGQVNDQSQIIQQVSGDQEPVPGIFFGLPAHDGKSVGLVEQAPGIKGRALR